MHLRVKKLKQLCSKPLCAGSAHLFHVAIVLGHTHDRCYFASRTCGPRERGDFETHPVAYFSAYLIVDAHMLACQGGEKMSTRVVSLQNFFNGSAT